MNISTPTKFIPKYHDFHDTCLQEKAKAGMKRSKILRNALMKAADYLYLDVLQA